MSQLIWPKKSSLGHRAKNSCKSAIFLFTAIFFLASSQSFAEEEKEDALKAFQKQWTKHLLENTPVDERLLAEKKRILEERSARGISAAKPQHAAEFKKQLQNLQKASHLYQLNPKNLESFIVSIESFNASYILMQDRFSSVGQKLKDGAAGNTFEQRLSDAKEDFEKQTLPVYEITTKIYQKSLEENPEKSINKLVSKLKKALSKLVQNDSDGDVKILGANQLPYRNQSLEQRSIDKENTITPTYLTENSSAEPTAADRTGTVNAPLSKAILNQAEALEFDYIRIYEFVKNNIQTEFYAGAMKGAEGTLLQGSGNDVDQASLLIALFRASGLSSRYVQGVVELSIDTIADSLGLQSANQATRALSAAGVAYTPLIRGGRLAAVEIEHTWVSAYVPYTNYRGSMVDASGSIWLPLMPALKKYEVSAGSSVFDAAQINADEAITDYLQEVQSEDVVKSIQTQIEYYFQENRAEENVQAQKTEVDLVPVNAGLLPATLEAKVVAVNREVADLPESQNHQIRFVIRSGDSQTSDTILDYTAPLSALAGNRVTLSYQAATIDDQNTINLFGGLELVPAYLVKLRPQIRINGEKVSVANESVDTGIHHLVEMEILGPNGTEKLEQVFLSGGYHAFAITGGNVNEILSEDHPGDTEFLGAKLLSGAAYDYAKNWQKGEEKLAGLMDAAVVRALPSIAIASNAYQVDTVLGVPSQIKWQAVTMDAISRVVQPIMRSADKANERERDYMKLSALYGSYWEHKIFEESFLVESISADKGIQLANEQQINVLTITQSNFANVQSQLTHPENVISSIKNWVDLGYEVTTPSTSITLEAWTGHVWKVEKTETGESGYFVSGGLAGSFTTLPGDAWILEYYHWAMSFLNTSSGSGEGEIDSITMIASTDSQEGIVGEPLSEAFSVIVRDKTGAPVAGAQVSFLVAAGNGALSESGDAPASGPKAITVETDGGGIASAYLTLGESTDVDTIYSYQNDGDEYPQKSSMNLVHAGVQATSKFLRIDEPFYAVAYPGEVASIDFSGVNELGRASRGAAVSIYTQALDQYRNVISNVNINYSVSNSGAYGDDCDASASTAEVESGGDRGTSASGITSVFGSHSIMYAGAGYRTHRVTMTAQNGATDFWEMTNFDCQECMSASVRVAVYTNELGYEAAAALPGETIAEGGFAISTYRYSSMTGEIPESGYGIEHEGLGGSSTGGTNSLGAGRYEYIPYAGSLAEEYGFVGTISNINSVLDNGSIEECGGGDLDDEFAYGAGTLWGVRPEITGIVSATQGALAPEYVYVNERMYSEYPAQVQVNIDPANYSSFLSELDIFVDGVWEGFRVLSPRFGQTGVNLPAGMIFDPLKNYEVQVVLNRGTKFEVRSEMFTLPIRRTLILDYTPTLRVSHSTDIINETVCEISDTFRFEISEPAEITLEFLDEDGEDVLDTLISGEVFEAGIHEVPVTINDLLPRQENYSFRLIGVSERDGNTEEKWGGASVSLRFEDNNLPIGHTIIKGVNVFDGNLSVSSQDISLPGRGSSLEFNRSFSNNNNPKPGFLGTGWGHNYLSQISINECGQIIVSGGAGGGMRFVGDGAGGLRPLVGYHGTLERDDSDRSFNFYTIDGTRYHYRNRDRSTWDLVYIQDTNGNTTTLGYDASTDVEEPARLLTVQDSNGRGLNFAYEKRNIPVTAATLSFSTGGTADVAETEEVHLLTSVTLTGTDSPVSMEYEYNQEGQLVRAIKLQGNTVLLSESYDYTYYRMNGDVPELDSEGNPIKLPLSQQNKMISYVDPNGNETTYEYEQRDASWTVEGSTVTIQAPTISITSVSEPEGAGAQFSFTINPDRSRYTEVTNARGVLNTFRMDRHGAVYRVEKTFGNLSTQWLENDVVPQSKTDENGVTTTFAYDLNGNMIREETAQLFSQSFDFANINGKIKNRVLRQTDRNGNVTESTYDENGNLTSVEDPEGGVTTHTYNGQGDKVSTEDPNGNVTNYQYDEFGNLSKVIDPLGGETTTTWNSRGLPVTITDALGRTTTHQYNALGHLVSTENAADGVRAYTYDNLGNKLTETDELGRTTSYSYDGKYRLTQITDPLGNTKSFTYDNNGNKLTETDWNGNITSYVYDDEDRLIGRTEPEGVITTYTYDSAGNKLTETIATAQNLEQTTQYSYDDLNRVIQIIDPIGGATSITYDGVGNKLTETDALGRVTSYAYDLNHRLVSMTDPLGGVTSYTYDANGNRLSEIDANGNERLFGYDELNRVIRIFDATGAVTVNAYDEVGNLVSVIDARLHETIYEYDVLNRNVAEVDPLGNRTEYVYDAVGNTVQETLANGNVVIHTYDELNRLTRSSDEIGLLTEKGYDANSNLVREVDANGNESSITYDGLNRVVAKALPEQRNVFYSFDVFGNVTSETDANGNITEFQYDLLNRMTSSTDPEGGQVEYTYDAVGNKLTETDRNGNTSTFEYDDLSRVISITDALGQDATFQYDAVGNTTQEINKRGHTTLYTYDPENRMLTTTKNNVTLITREYDAVGNKVVEKDANGNKLVYLYSERNELVEESRPLAAITYYSYDEIGNTIEERDPEGRISGFQYDLRRRLIAQTNGEGETERYSFDSNGNRTELRRPSGNTWTYEYDGANRLVEVSAPDGGETAYSYDANGNRLTQRDANGNTTSFDYDALNRRIGLRYPDGQLQSYSYDANGNLTSMTNANGQTISYQYDALNRQTRQTLPSLSADNVTSIQNTYDENNNITRISEAYAGTTGTRVTEQTFDNFDRLTSKTDPRGENIRYTYDKNGNRTSVRDPDGTITTYTFDDLNRVIRVLNTQGVTEYYYDRSSLKTRVTYPNGTIARWYYDEAKRTTEVRNLQGVAEISRFEYSYDSNGNRIQQVETNGGAPETINYEFDTADRLTEESYPTETTTYSYDDAYNRTSEVTVDSEGTQTVNKTYQYNNRNQLTNVIDNLDATGSASYEYDDNGNRVSKTIDSEVTLFVYDARDQLRQITQGGSTIGAFLYDYQGLRVRKETQDSTLRYVYDDQSVLMQTTDGGDTVAKYDYGPDKLLSLTHVTEGTQFYLFDALGSVVNLTRVDGSIQNRTQYYAWGNIRNEVGESENPFGFTGHEMDEESGLIYMKARFYDPDIGLFLSNDPFEGTVDTPPSLHKYLYAAGNPIIYVDANGNFFILGDIADGLAQLRNNALDAAASLDNTGSARGFNRVAAGFAGVGAGVFGLLEGAVRTVNFAGNLAVEATATVVEAAGGDMGDSFFVKDARNQLDQSVAALEQAYDVITEDPGAVGTAIVNSVVETGKGVIDGDPGAIARATSTLTEIVGGGGAAGAGVKVGAAATKQAMKGVNKALDKVGETTKKVTEGVKKLAENARKGTPAKKRDVGNGSFEAEGDFGPLNQPTPKRGFVSGDPGALRDIVKGAKAGNPAKQGELEVIKALRDRGENVHAINDKLKLRKEQGRFHEFFFGGDRPSTPEQASGIAGEVKTPMGVPLKENAIFNHADKAAHKQLQPDGGVLFFNLKHTTTNQEQLDNIMKALKTGEGIDRPLPDNVEVEFLQ